MRQAPGSSYSAFNPPSSIHLLCDLVLQLFRRALDLISHYPTLLLDCVDALLGLELH
jgi:hypothetical protein